MHVRRSATLAVAAIVAACSLLDPTTRSGPSASSLLLWRNSQVASADRSIFDDHRVYTLALNHVVSAIDKHTGTTLWQTQLPVSVGRNGDGIMFAAGHLIVGDIGLYALDPSTGHQVWMYTPSVGAWPGYSKQWTDGSTIFCGSGTGHVYAVDAATGTERWARHIVDDTNTNVYSPAVAGGVVFVGYTQFRNPPQRLVRGGVAALDAASGQLLWARLVPHGDSTDDTGVWGDPDAIIVTGSMVVTQVSDGLMYGFDRQTGNLLITVPAATFAKPSFVIGSASRISDLPSLAVSGDVLIMASSVFETITAVSTVDLHRLWSTPFVFGSPTRISVDSTRIYSGAAGGQFAVYDFDGKLIWTINRGDLRSDGQEGLFWAPSIDTDRIYLPGNFEVYAFKKY